VPALKPKPMKEGEALREIAALPDWARPAFSGMKSLNRLQSAVCDAALFSGENMLICAPTGAWGRRRQGGKWGVCVKQPGARSGGSPLL
jgi:hypothetical protein